MRVTKQSMLTGVIHTREIDVTEEQITTWKNGELIQDAMPQLTPEDREFMLSGATQEEWDAAYPIDEEEYTHE